MDEYLRKLPQIQPQLVNTSSVVIAASSVPKNAKNKKGKGRTTTCISSPISASVPGSAKHADSFVGTTSEKVSSKLFGNLRVANTTSQVPVMVVSPMQHQKSSVEPVTLSTQSIRTCAPSSTLTTSTVANINQLTMQGRFQNSGILLGQGIVQNGSIVIGNSVPFNIFPEGLTQNHVIQPNSFINNLCVIPTVPDGSVQGSVTQGFSTSGSGLPVNQLQFGTQDSPQFSTLVQGLPAQNFQISSPPVSYITENASESMPTVSEKNSAVSFTTQTAFQSVLQADHELDQKLKGESSTSSMTSVGDNMKSNGNKSIKYKESAKKTHCNAEEEILPIKIESCYSMKKLSLIEMLQLLEKGHNIMTYVRPLTFEYYRAKCLCKAIVKHKIESIKSDLKEDFFAGLVSPYITLNEVIHLKRNILKTFKGNQNPPKMMTLHKVDDLSSSFGGEEKSSNKEIAGSKSKCGTEQIERTTHQLNGQIGNGDKKETGKASVYNNKRAITDVKDLTGTLSSEKHCEAGVRSAGTDNGKSDKNKSDLINGSDESHPELAQETSRENFYHLTEEEKALIRKAYLIMQQSGRSNEADILKSTLGREVCKNSESILHNVTSDQGKRSGGSKETLMVVKSELSSGACEQITECSAGCLEETGRKQNIVQKQSVSGEELVKRINNKQKSKGIMGNESQSAKEANQPISDSVETVSEAEQIRKAFTLTKYRSIGNSSLSTHDVFPSQMDVSLNEKDKNSHDQICPVQGNLPSSQCDEIVVHKSVPDEEMQVSEVVMLMDQQMKKHCSVTEDRSSKIVIDKSSSRSHSLSSEEALIDVESVNTVSNSAQTYFEEFEIHDSKSPSSDRSSKHIEPSESSSENIEPSDSSSKLIEPSDSSSENIDLSDSSCKAINGEEYPMNDIICIDETGPSRDSTDASASDSNRAMQNVDKLISKREVKDTESSDENRGTEKDEDSVSRIEIPDFDAYDLSNIKNEDSAASDFSREIKDGNATDSPTIGDSKASGVVRLPSELMLGKWNKSFVRNIKRKTYDCTCYLCGMLFEDAKMNWKHIINEHAKMNKTPVDYPSYICTHCHEIHETYASVITHEVEIHLCEFPCYFCGFSVDDSLSMLRHVADMHNKVFTCNVCKGQVVGKWEFQKHCISAEHLQGKLSAKKFLLQCLFCKTKFDSKMKFEAHMMTRHIGKPIVNSGECVCMSCRHSFLDEQALQNHRDSNARKFEEKQPIKSESLAKLLIQGRKRWDRIECLTHIQIASVAATSSIDDYFGKNDLSLQATERELTVGSKKYRYQFEALAKFCELDIPLPSVAQIMDDLIRLLIKDYRGLQINTENFDLHILLVALSRSPMFAQRIKACLLEPLPWSGRIQSCVEMFLLKVEAGCYKNTNFSVLCEALQRCLNYLQDRLNSTTLVMGDTVTESWPLPAVEASETKTEPFPPKSGLFSVASQALKEMLVRKKSKSNSECNSIQSSSTVSKAITPSNLTVSSPWTGTSQGKNVNEQILNATIQTSVGLFHVLQKDSNYFLVPVSQNLNVLTNQTVQSTGTSQTLQSIQVTSQAIQSTQVANQALQSSGALNLNPATVESVVTPVEAFSSASTFCLPACGGKSVEKLHLKGQIVPAAHKTSSTTMRNWIPIAPKVDISNPGDKNILTGKNVAPLIIRKYKMCDEDSDVDHASEDIPAKELDNINSASAGSKQWIQWYKKINKDANIMHQEKKSFPAESAQSESTVEKEDEQKSNRAVGSSPLKKQCMKRKGFQIAEAKNSMREMLAKRKRNTDSNRKDDSRAMKYLKTNHSFDQVLRERKPVKYTYDDEVESDKDSVAPSPAAYSATSEDEWKPSDDEYDDVSDENGDSEVSGEGDSDTKTDYTEDRSIGCIVSKGMVNPKIHVGSCEDVLSVKEKTRTELGGKESKSDSYRADRFYDELPVKETVGNAHDATESKREARTRRGKEFRENSDSVPSGQVKIQKNFPMRTEYFNFIENSKIVSWGVQSAEKWQDRKMSQKESSGGEKMKAVTKSMNLNECNTKNDAVLSIKSVSLKRLAPCLPEEYGPFKVLKVADTVEYLDCCTKKIPWLNTYVKCSYVKLERNKKADSLYFETVSSCTDKYSKRKHTQYIFKEICQEGQNRLRHVEKDTRKEVCVDKSENNHRAGDSRNDTLQKRKRGRPVTCVNVVEDNNRTTRNIIRDSSRKSNNELENGTKETGCTTEISRRSRPKQNVIGTVAEPINNTDLPENGNEDDETSVENEDEWHSRKQTFGISDNLKQNKTNQEVFDRVHNSVHDKTDNGDFILLETRKMPMKTHVKEEPSEECGNKGLNKNPLSYVTKGVIPKSHLIRLTNNEDLDLALKTSQQVEVCASEKGEEEGNLTVMPLQIKKDITDLDNKVKTCIAVVVPRQQKPSDQSVASLNSQNSFQQLLQTSTNNSDSADRFHLASSSEVTSFLKTEHCPPALVSQAVSSSVTSGSPFVQLEEVTHQLMRKPNLLARNSNGLSLASQSAVSGLLQGPPPLVQMATSNNSQATMQTHAAQTTQTERSTQSQLHEVSAIENLIQKYNLNQPVLQQVPTSQHTQISSFLCFVPVSGTNQFIPVNVLGGPNLHVPGGQLQQGGEAQPTNMLQSMPQAGQKRYTNFPTVTNNPVQQQQNTGLQQDSANLQNSQCSNPTVQFNLLQGPLVFSGPKSCEGQSSLKQENGHTTLAEQQNTNQRAQLQNTSQNANLQYLPSLQPMTEMPTLSHKLPLVQAGQTQMALVNTLFGVGQNYLKGSSQPAQLIHGIQMSSSGVQQFEDTGKIQQQKIPLISPHGTSHTLLVNQHTPLTPGQLIYVPDAGSSIQLADTSQNQKIPMISSEGTTKSVIVNQQTPLAPDQLNYAPFTTENCNAFTGRISNTIQTELNQTVQQTVNNQDQSKETGAKAEKIDKPQNRQQIAKGIIAIPKPWQEQNREPARKCEVKLKESEQTCITVKADSEIKKEPEEVGQSEDSERIMNYMAMDKVGQLDGGGTGQDAFVKWKLKLKLRETEMKEQSNTCLKCSRTFEDGTNYTAHLNMHTSGSYSCLPCHQPFQDQFDYSLHKALKHNKYFNCKLCRRMFKKMSTVRMHFFYEHQLEHSEAVKMQIKVLFSCYICKEGFEQERKLRVHLKTHFGGYFCKVCANQFESMKSLEQHYLNRHGKCYICNKCEEKLDNEMQVSNHINAGHFSLDKFGHPVTAFYTCKNCDAKFQVEGGEDSAFYHVKYEHTFEETQEKVDDWCDDSENYEAALS